MEHSLKSLGEEKSVSRIGSPSNMQTPAGDTAQPKRSVWSSPDAELSHDTEHRDLGQQHQPVVAPARSSRYRIRAADPLDARDRAAIVRLWVENLPHISPSICAERFEWLYRDNPLGPTHTWLAFDNGSGDVVGCASVLPRQVVVEGELFHAGLAIDFSIDRRHRSYGVAIQLQRAVSEQIWEHGIRFVFAFPNSPSRGVFRRVGYQTIGKCWRGARLIRSFGKLRQHLRPISLAATVGAGIDVVLLLQNRIALRSGEEGITAGLVDSLDERWERFWEKSQPSICFGGVCDREHLLWYYRQPGAFHHFYGLFDASEELLGYLSFLRHGDVLVISDIRVRERRWLKPLLDRFWQEMRQEGALVINLGVVGSEEMITLFHQAGFVSRPCEGWAGLLQSPDLEIDLLEILRDREKAWCLADVDLDL